ncbi:MAG: hypothetical protein AB1540_00750 [Bdellovibrionota bacterium]
METFETTFLLMSSFGLGIVHAFEVDHLAAVSAFVATGPRPRDAALYGAKWALGHGLSLLVFCLILFSFKLVLSDSFAHWMERLVGIALVGVGGLTLIKAMGSQRLEGFKHQGPFWMGILHGVAGTAAFAGASLVVFSSGLVAVAGYALAFGAGILTSTVLYAGVLGGILGTKNLAENALGRGTRTLMGLWSCAVGLIWIFR